MERIHKIAKVFPYFSYRMCYVFNRMCYVLPGCVMFLTGCVRVCGGENPQDS